MSLDPSEVDAAMALALARALAAETRAAAKSETMLVSVTADLIARPQPGEAQSAVVRIVRATKSLVFAEADLTGDDGRRLMTASGVYRIVGKSV
jgi:acyl-coenzyme A thioesterase PaaI-like protein